MGLLKTSIAFPHCWQFEETFVKIWQQQMSVNMSEHCSRPVLCQPKCTDFGRCLLGKLSTFQCSKALVHGYSNIKIVYASHCACIYFYSDFEIKYIYTCKV